MDANNMIVAGRRFRTKTDYEAALRDEQKIKQLRKQFDLTNKTDILRLYAELQSGSHTFESALGNDFDDEIFDLSEKCKSGVITAKQTKGKRKASAHKESRKAADAGSASGTRGVTGASGVTDNRSGVNGRSTVNSRSTPKGTEQLPPGRSAEDESLRQEAFAILKKKEKRRKLVAACCGLLAMASLTYYGIYAYTAQKNGQEYQELARLRNSDVLMAMPEQQGQVHRTGEIELPDILDEYKTLYNLNKTLIGYIAIDDTSIEYPVLQTVNNEYYLDHNFKQEYDKNGSIFMDYRCVLYPRNTNLIIYGHHMKSGKMFGELQKYARESFYIDHPVIQFDTIYEKGTYQIMYAFRSKIYNENEILFKYYQFFDANSAEEFDSNMREMAKMSLYDTGVEAQFGDQLLTLSTCDNSQSDGRFVVVAKRVS